MRIIRNIGLTILTLIAFFACEEKEDEINTAPKIKNHFFEVFENISDTDVIGNITAIDEEDDKLYFLIKENDEDLFELSRGGQLSLVTGKKLDYETKTSHIIIIEVSDGLNSRTAEITIEVKDVNENEAPIIESQSFTVPEDIADNEVIGKVMATDPNGDVLSFSVVDNASFEITSEGELSLIEGKKFDYETNTKHIVIIKVSDGELFNEAEITINITDVAESEAVNIPDGNFLSALLTSHTIDTNGNSQIEVTEAATYSGEIHVGGLNITDLTGIEAFLNITKLIFNDNQIENVDLSNNKQLKVIYSYSNPLVGLNVSQNTLLEDLRCSYNSLNNLDVSENVNLKILNANNNNLESIDLSKNVLLEHVSLSENKLSSIDVSQNLNIKNIYLPKNNLTSLDASNLPQLTVLNCQDNKLTSINVNNSTALKDLVLINNNLPIIDVSTNVKLDYLALKSNNLDYLDLSKNENLRVLNAEINAIGKVTTANSEALKEIYLSYNQLTYIDVFENTSLEVLFIPHNKLIELDLSNNPSLTSVNLAQNNLEKVNIANGNNANIQSFNARYNDGLSCVQIDTNFVIDLNMGIWQINPEVTSFSYSPCN